MAPEAALGEDRPHLGLEELGLLARRLAGPRGGGDQHGEAGGTKGPGHGGEPIGERLA